MNDKGEIVSKGKMNMCDICLREYSACMNEHDTTPEIVYGDTGNGIGDSVLECSWFMGEVKP